jgi:hypothetical protein
MATAQLPRRSRTRRFTGLFLVALTVSLAVGCADDDDGDAGAAPTSAAESEQATPTAAGEEPAALAVTLTESALEGLPDEVPAGAVGIDVRDETESAGGELNFTQVQAGTTEADFFEFITTVFGGGEISERLLDNAGVTGSATITLDPGEYIVWYDLASELERESTEDDLVTATLTVTGGDADAELPEADGTITASDYRFDVDVSAGPSTVNFHNASEQQLHHVILVDLGTNDPATVEQNLPAILEAEEASDLPEGIDADQVDFEFGGSGVFGPGSAGTFEATFEAGHTYAAVCFIQDREGGPPHALAHEMYEVFQVEAG